MLGLALGLWVVGVQTHELFATVGAWGTAACVAADVFRRGERPSLRAHGPLLAFLGWSLLVPTLAGELPTGTGVARLSDWLLLPVAAQAFTLASARQRRAVAIAAGLTMTLSCLVAGCQHFGLWPPVEAFDGLEWTRIRFSRVYEAAPNAEHRFMAGGLLFHRLKFANVTSLATVVALGFALRWPGRERALAFGLAALGLLSVAIFPYARTALVSLVLGLALLLLLSVQRKSVALAGVVALLLATIGAVLLSPDLRERFASATSAEGSGERTVLLSTGLAAIKAHPLAGVGAGRFHPGLFAEADAPAQVTEHEGKAHNQFVSLAAESGVIGGLLFLVLLASIARVMWQRRPASLGPLCALAVFTLLSLTHDPLFHAELSLGLVLVLGLGQAVTPAEPGQ
jgi:O-antigen ligase